MKSLNGFSEIEVTERQLERRLEKQLRVESQL